MFGIRRSSVKRYVNRNEEFGSLVPSRPPGSSPKIDDRAKTLLQSDLEERPAATLAQRDALTCERLLASASASPPSGGA